MGPQVSASRRNHKRSFFGPQEFIVSALALSLVLVPWFAQASGKIMVVTWGGNSPEWNKILGVSAIRLGCSSAPPSCVQQAGRLANQPLVSAIFLAILLEPANIVENVAAYVQMSGTHPELAEIGFDDFVGQAHKSGLSGEALSSILGKIAGQLHASGSRLKWGITLYQDELWHGKLAKLDLSDDVRRAVDVVHLFPHYRQEQVSLEKAISEAKRLFPNAQIILGIYAYDRREYLPCSSGGVRCTDEQEVALFDQNLRESLDLVHRGVAAGVEFYPGNFGAEASWKGWDDPRICKQNERSACIQNTLAMRQKLQR